MRNVININEKWAFSKESREAPKKMPENWVWVNLPHTWNNIDGLDGDNDYYRGRCFYAKELKKSDLPEMGCSYLEINGANSYAEVFLNGECIAAHGGGYSTWRTDITDKLKDENLLVIAVDNSERPDIYPQTADFTFYGGLYRDVNIICTPKTHFALNFFGGKGIWVTPEIQGQNARVEINTAVTNEDTSQEMRFFIYDMNGQCVAEKRGCRSKEELVIENVHLWDGRRDPYLYTARAEICKNGEVIDAVSTRFGCRSFEIHPEKGFILNGREYPLRGVSRHQDRCGIGNALLKEHHREDMDLICEMGANTIRLAHYQHDQYFYDLCDENGMVVWAEIPYISRHTPDGLQNTVTQMRELITQNYNHPSIVVWGLSNEITMGGEEDEDLLQNHQILNELCHEMDKTRLTTIACVTMCDINAKIVKIPDTVAYNHYFGWYGGDTTMNGPWFDNFHAHFPGIPIACSEYGCEALNWHTSDPQQGDYTEEYQAYYHEELIKQFFTRKYLWATYVWNMFDFGADARNEGGENGLNHKGLVTIDRKYKKDAFYAYKAWLSDEPFVHICGKRYVDRAEETTKVTVYSSCDEVELFANGRSLGKKKSEEHFFYFDVPNEGITDLEAVAGECRDKSVIRKTDKFNEEYRLKEKGAVLNWFDITAPEGVFSLNDKVSELISNQEGRIFFTSLASKVFGSAGMDKTKTVGMDLNAGMLQMLGGFTVLRLINLLGTLGKRLTKEEMLEINKRLNQIEK